MAIHSTIRYVFTFNSGETKEFLLTFNEATLDLIPSQDYQPPEWTALAFNQCDGCPLDPQIHACCPTALHLGRILEELQGHTSFEEVLVEVFDTMRTYSKRTSLQDGLGSLIGLVMPTGGCPLLKPLRPMVRFHLPFASLEEMEYRMVSMYLFAQYLRKQQGEEPDLELGGLQKIYSHVNCVNKSFAYRISAASSCDTGINAIIILDCFAKTVPKAIQNMMKDFRPLFAPYLEG